ncbi:MAG: SGNH/GDSL hydrolase family protein [Myxococcota bacterium]|nr:SGNH/GDSL hydrolase family protein [Myxococcota bacterium]
MTSVADSGANPTAATDSASGNGDASSGGDAEVHADASGVEPIHYYGRWNRLTDRAITVNGGSHVSAHFTGAGIAARFDMSLNQPPLPTLAWQIDQAAWQEGELAPSLSMATGLTSGPHDVLLMVRGLNENQSRWAPPLISSITFLGLDVVGGTLEPSSRPVRPKIEFLGDSITEGVAVWSTHAGQTTPCWRSDARVSYASQASQTLGAEWRQVGFGRQGLLIGGNGGVPTANTAFNWMYQGVPRDIWQADLVIINQGTNDGSASATAFAPAYTAFVSTVRAGYPNAKIVAMRPFGGAHAIEIKAEVDRRIAAGDSRVYYVDTTGWLSVGDFTDGVHPNAQGSAKAAQALVAAIGNIKLP